MRASLLLLLLPAVSLAVPVPKQTEKEKIEAKFGKIVDPKGDSKFALDGDKLVVTLPANETRSIKFRVPNLNSATDDQKALTTAPVVEHEVGGDFVATVRVTMTLDPKSNPIRKETVLSFICGGIQLSWPDSGFFFIGTYQRVIGKQSEKRYLFESSDGGSGVMWFGSDPEPPDAIWVRLERTGEELVCSHSTDGRKFKKLMSAPKEVPVGKLTLGLSAHHSSDKAHTVTFDEFKVEKK